MDSIDIGQYRALIASGTIPKKMKKRSQPEEEQEWPRTVGQNFGFLK